MFCMLALSNTQKLGKMKNLILAISILITGLATAQDWRDSYTPMVDNGDLAEFGMVSPTKPSETVRFAKSSFQWDDTTMLFMQYSYLNLQDPYSGIRASFDELEVALDDVNFNKDVDSLIYEILSMQEETMSRYGFDEFVSISISKDVSLDIVINRFELILTIEERN